MDASLQWDDLRYVLAIGREGSLAGAARTLRVTHSTVFRRIGVIEARLAVRLFDRQRRGYLPTPAGEEALTLAMSVEEEVTALERRLSGADLRPKGLVRLTTTDAVSPTVVPLCASFRRRYPEISVELTTGYQLLDLTRRDADVAIRASAAPPENLHGRRIAKIAFSVYASTSYLASHGSSCREDQQDWIGMAEAHSGLAGPAFVRAKAAPGRIGLTATSFLSARDGAIAGMGLTLLPCYLGDRAAELERVGPLLPELATDLWLLVHDDLRHTARIRVFADFLWEELKKLQPSIEGEAPS